MEIDNWAQTLHILEYSLPNVLPILEKAYKVSPNDPFSVIPNDRRERGIPIE